MRISKNGINLIKEFEGCYLRSYKCPAGVWTIGYGHTDGVKQGEQITKERAEYLLITDLATFEKGVNALKFNLNQNQFDALVSFSFNCGLGNLKKLVKGRNLTEIGNALLLYNKAKGKVLVGLTRRRKAERDLFFKSTKLSTTDIAKQVINGKWGNGLDRKKRLENAGYDYKTIQSEVNRLLKGGK